jgi:hypothetical protein
LLLTLLAEIYLAAFITAYLLEHFGRIGAAYFWLGAVAFSALVWLRGLRLEKQARNILAGILDDEGGRPRSRPLSLAGMG